MSPAPLSRRAPRVLWSVLILSVLLGPPALYVARTGVEIAELLDLVIVVLGVVALVAMVLAVVTPSRLRSLTAAFGIDRVMSGHRWLGVGALVLTVVHLVLAVVERPRLLNPLAASTGIQFGYLATAAMIGLSVAAAWGRRPGARYERWARVHVLLAAAGIVLAGMHVYWLGDLLEDPVMRVVCSVLALAVLAVTARRWVWQPLFSARGAYVVYGLRRESAGVHTLALVPISFRERLRFAPGQFVWLRTRRRVLGAEEHPFTIASSADTSGRLELTIRADGDYTRTLATLTPGTKVWLDGPHGSFTPGPDDDADGLVLVAGGVGVTPMMSMLRTLAERGDERRHRLVLAERPDEPLFGPELEALGRRLDLEILRTCGRRLDAALLADLVPPVRNRFDYFVCGPVGLRDAAVAALEELGVDPARIRTEQFGWTGALPVPPARRAPESSSGDALPSRRHRI